MNSSIALLKPVDKVKINFNDTRRSNVSKSNISNIMKDKKYEKRTTSLMNNSITSGINQPSLNNSMQRSGRGIKNENTLSNMNKVLRPKVMSSIDSRKEGKSLLNESL